MSFGLTIGTERAVALQKSIQDELTKRGYSPDADPVMAEYITIMVINNKTAAQITGELEDLIGSDFDHTFTDWLFAEAAKGVTETDTPSQPESSSLEPPTESALPRDIPPHISNDSRRSVNPPRNGVYQQALSQAFPSSASSQKRSASARSPSPSHPNKSRRTDVPTGPRAMFRDGGSSSSANPHPNTRSLLDRVGGPAGPSRNGNAPNGFAHEDIQSRIDNIVNSSPDQNMMMPGGFPVMGGAGGMDMNAMAGMANPLMLQEMMMNQMAMMAQMASSMGMMNGAAGQFGFPGVMPGDMGMMQGAGMSNGFQGSAVGGNGNGLNNSGRGRGGARGGRGVGRGRGGSSALPARAKSPDVATTKDKDISATPQSSPIVITEPTPAVPVTPSFSSAPLQRTGFVVPERPQSPTLCKFGLKCTNAHCRYAHPSPVATAESGVVLSNEPCEKGKDCQDKDCIKSHVSPAVLNPQANDQPVNPTVASTPNSHHSPVPCRFGAACTRPGCSFMHPARSSSNSSQNNHFAQQCRFGAGCTRASCSFQHPEGRVLPTTFHRGLSTTSPMVTVQPPETGSMGGPSPHRSVKFNNGLGTGIKEKLEQQMKEIEKRKGEAERAVREAEAAASKKDSNPVAIAT